MELARTAKEPFNYFLLLRALFRSIGGGSHDLLYQEFLPLLPSLLQGWITCLFNKATTSATTLKLFFVNWPTLLFILSEWLMPGFINSGYPENLELFQEQVTAPF